MTNAFWDGQRSRKILERIIVEGDFVTESPLHVGSGEKMSENDAPLFRDEETGKPLLTGASLAGALRNHLVELESGYHARPLENGFNALLFGGTKSDDYGEQSPLIIWDALGKGVASARDGVKLDGVSRTAADQTLFNFEIWQTGTTFRLHFEILIYEQVEEDELALKAAFYTILQALSDGAIAFGGRKNRGYGRGKVSQWYVRHFNMANINDLIAWLQYDQEQPLSAAYASVDLATDLGATYNIKDNRQEFCIQATFSLPYSLLIRTYSDKTDTPDAVHLTEDGNPILSGTSLAGVWRTRAEKIAYSFDGQVDVQAMFGFADETQHKNSRASRVIFHETQLEQAHMDLIQTRIKIDRFTGGVIEGALFDEQPAWGGTCKITVILRNPQFAEIGLMLLVLKDLWTQDLPLGGTSSIGRGRLQGYGATLTYGDQVWELGSDGGVVAYQVNGNDYDTSKGAEALQSYVNTLWGVSS